MNSLKRSVRLCAAFNGNNLQVYQQFSSIRKFLDGYKYEKKRSEYEMVTRIWCTDLMNEWNGLRFQNEQKMDSSVWRKIRFIECVSWTV